ncbi:transglutaminase-like domain-containing protein [Paenibacillus methanolicus]|uniref:Transglutaminase superfamily protein n=1 Tax=Paenibacillus methanolicus TaxID=582686 RepID=A0A5S5BWK1_9BACL|nr:transglutaminase-like domain-containing protein [Paenibacillus methanolicus]TYP71359.1 transglutaminase superfamily protein [Paenibacillus methanolicus]
MNGWVQALLKPEPVALLVLVVLLVSLIQGVRRGASGSAKHLFFFVWETASTVLSLVLAGKFASRMSPYVRDWLIAREITVPREELGPIKQLWYTFATSLRDFELLRFGVLFLLLYMLIRLVLGQLYPLAAVLFERLSVRPADAGLRRGQVKTGSRAAGALLGAMLGAGRSFVALAVLFIYVTLLPSGPLVDEIRGSSFYAKTADELLEPVAGDALAKRGPVLTEAVQTEFKRVLQRKYEVIDAAVPADIEEAAETVTAKARGDEAKARALYDWLGSRIAYDWEKARNYEERGVWKEQTPADTFASRKGVCIDVARLYAVMARTVGLEVRVVTGQGADGRGGYGPHAWNEVRLADQGGQWIPLDATWAASGNWFNPADFDRTHIRES